MQQDIMGSRIILLAGYDTMVIFLLLFTKRKSFQSINFSLGRIERGTGKDSNKGKTQGETEDI